MQKAKKDLSNILGYLLEPIIKIWQFEKSFPQSLPNLAQIFAWKIVFASQKPEFPRLKFGENLPKI